MAVGARWASRKARHTADGRFQGVIALLPTARAQADEFVAHLPEVAGRARTGAYETKRTLDSMPEPTLKELAVGSIGLAAGLYAAGAPRLIVLAAMTPGVLAAASVATRQPSRRLQ
jgi:hypothetical protein